MMHTIRLLQVAHEIMTKGTITNKCVSRDELLAIKNGQLSYNEIINMAKSLFADIETALLSSTLPITTQYYTSDCIVGFDM
ncbi:hypothetical protein JMI89_11280 [Frischella sp. Ac48]|uniref:Uncharacterized protein n=1 Tax=Frischella japonica TaxID=2741544 RepID=A0ABR7QZW2_9GAMM|nr:MULTISPECIES: hypothetical protein [Frischella]MBC9131756.1 hypothetical protein [Frischella japonica]MBX4134207.1 hypothetical protein [Frischella sp. Ac48]